jgi:hypothetical protein
MFYVLYRDPQSLLVNDWKVQGAAPTSGYTTWEAARDAAAEMHKTMYYDVMVVAGGTYTLTQSDSRSNF